MDYLKNKNLGGWFLWELSFDDFRGTCGSEKFPLLNALNYATDQNFQGYVIVGLALVLFMLTLVKKMNAKVGHDNYIYNDIL